MTPSPLAAFPATIDWARAGRAMTAAVAASGGCTVSATLGTVPATFTYAPARTVAATAVEDAWASGSVTTGGHRTRYVAHWQDALGGSVWVDDGTRDGGKTWLQVPQVLDGLLDPGTVRAHPPVALVPLLRRAMPDLAAADVVISPTGSARLVGTETVDGRTTGHYTWTTVNDGRRQDLWLGRDWLPRRHAFSVRTGGAVVTVTADYRRWGPVKAVHAPPPDRVTVAPTRALPAGVPAAPAPRVD